jgi:hypothetical protein
MSRLWVAIVGVLAMLTMAGVASTTTASAASFAYDVPTVARAGVHPIDGAEAGPTQLVDAGKVSDSPSLDGHGASTTPAAGSVAANTVKPRTDVVTGEAYSTSA